MATENGHIRSLPPAHVIGKAFVEQYYNILRLSPEVVHKFYQDISILARPDPDGTMTSVTTMIGINDKIMSLKYDEYNFEIESVDAQNSFKDGVIVLVTGCLVEKANTKKKFTQAFFLAPQDNGGFFVLNDVFRFISEAQVKEQSYYPEYPSPDPVSTSPSSEEVEIKNLEISDPLIEEDIPDNKKLEDDSLVDEAIDIVQDDGPKKSYASILKVAKGNNPAVYVPTTKAKLGRTKTAEKQAVEPAPVPVQEPAPSPSTNNLAQETTNSHEEEGHAVYARNLPLNATPAEVEELFKKFGTIKPGGVQVRNQRQYGYCFGFVEFESESSVQAAIEASPLEISGQRVIVEVKRTTSRGNDGGAASGRGQFSQGPRGGGGGFRGGSNRFRGGDGFRGRGGSYNHNGYPRMEFRTRAAAPGHQFGRGAATRGGGAGGEGMMNQAAGIPA